MVISMYIVAALASALASAVYLYRHGDSEERKPWEPLALAGLVIGILALDGYYLPKASLLIAVIINSALLGAAFIGFRKSQAVGARAVTVFSIISGGLSFIGQVMVVVGYL